MNIDNFELIWNQKTIDKIKQKHNVVAEEVWEVIYDNLPHITIGAKTQSGTYYYILGRTRAGRYLFIVLKQLYHHQYRPITARTMQKGEQKLYTKKNK